MEIRKVNIGTKTFRIFEVKLFAGTSSEVIVPAAEERLDKTITDMMEMGRYDDVRAVDEMYGYVVPQIIADSEDEALITMTVEDIYDK